MRAVPLFWLLGTVTVACAAEELAPLDEDFLEYLGAFEADDADWVVLAAAAQREAQKDADAAARAERQATEAAAPPAAEKP